MDEAISTLLQKISDALPQNASSEYNDAVSDVLEVVEAFRVTQIEPPKVENSKYQDILRQLGSRVITDIVKEVILAYRYSKLEDKDLLANLKAALNNSLRGRVSENTEYANMKPEAWGANVRPALADRNGWCDLLGVPEGRNHYYDVYTRAQASMQEHGAASEFGAFTWKSADILPPAEIAAARADLDAQTFEQEYEASFINFSGRAYYTFADANKMPVRKLYDPQRPLIICLDFNVAPGVAVVCQEIAIATLNVVATCVIAEVWIENNSNTPAVCRKLLQDWRDHIGRIEVFGDATGGARGTAQTQGSDWDLARGVLTKGAGELQGFGSRVSFHVKSANPEERARVNAMNSRLCTAAGVRRLLVDPTHAPHVVKDLEGVPLLKGGSGEIDKKKYPMLTHVTDALGYYVDYRFPVVKNAATVSEFVVG